MDALRALAAAYVVLYHLYGWPRMESPPSEIWYYLFYPLHWGYTGVHLFLILSGFCIHMAALRSESRVEAGGFHFIQFWKRRLHRLYPPYLAAVLLSAMVGLAISVSGLREGHPIIQMPPPPYTTTSAFYQDILLHLLMLHIFFRSTLLGLFNGPLWSLALEEQLYLLYQPFLWFRKSWGLRGALLVAGGSTLIFRSVPYFLPETGDPWANWLWYGPSRWFEWCLGCLAVEAYSQKVSLPSWCYQPALAVLLYGIGLQAGPLSDLLIGLASFILVNWAVAKEARGAPATSVLRTLASIGVWSYSLYLVHHPILQLTSFVMVALHLESLPNLLRVLIMLSSVFVGAYCFFLLIERRFLNKPKVGGRH